MRPPWDIEALRQQFPILSRRIHGHPLIYLDSAATAQKPRAVITALSDFYSHDYATVHRAVYQLAARASTRYAAIRQQVANFLGAARSEEIIFTRGATEALNLIAHSFGSLLPRGAEILLVESEHHSNIVPWQLLAKRQNLHLRIVPLDQRGDIDRSALAKLLTPQTALLAIAHIANVTGTLHPISELTTLAHRQGAKVVVDGTQAVAHLPVNVTQLGADFYAFSGHKAFAPTGVGVLYGRYQLLEQMPPLFGGGDMIATVDWEQTSYQPPPLRFEAGTPMIAQVIGLGAALEFIEALGRPAIHAWEMSLHDYAKQCLSTLPGIRWIGNGEHKGAILSFVIAGIHPLDLGTLLDLQGIAVRTGHQCAQPTLRRFACDSLVRISFAPFNTPQEIETLRSALQTICQSLRSA